MMNVSGGARAGGMITPAMMSPADRQAALAYITANFGADKPVRSTKVEEYPLDEKVLGRAMYIEYYLLGGYAEAGAYQRRRHLVHAAFIGECRRRRALSGSEQNQNSGCILLIPEKP